MKRILFIIFLSSLLIGLIAQKSYTRLALIGPCLSQNQPMMIPEDFIPDEKLPWPHQRPDLSQAEYEELIRKLWVINNYGIYQASEDKSLVYFHSGLDVVLLNGTKLYAVESGYVKAVIENKHIIIGDTQGNSPGNGWDYVHVTNFQFQEGDFVNQGEYIADVLFEGLSHVHLSRVYLEKGSWESYENINCTHPDKYFIYVDTEPPIIKKPFYYFRNNTDILMENTHPTVVWGDVDIVVTIRDPGEFARSKVDGFGDRLCIARIEYEISGETSQLISRKSFDFTKIIVNNMEELGKDRVLTVFKHYTVFPEGIKNGDGDVNNFIITNTDGTGEFEKIDTSARNYGWDTAALDQSGKRLFPDGLYYITVKASDFLGNSSSATDTVVVWNGKKKGKRRR